MGSLTSLGEIFECIGYGLIVFYWFENPLIMLVLFVVIIETLYVNYNSLDGKNAIPPELCRLNSHGCLFNVWADCHRAVDPVICECCTVCCNPFSHCSPASLENNSIVTIAEDDI
jgi:hypothetical protein